MTQLAEATMASTVHRELPPGGHSGGEPKWLKALRRRGAERFERAGYPSRKQEAWRHTNLRPITETDFNDAGEADGSALFEEYSFGTRAAAELVFVNGRFSPDLSSVENLPAKLKVSAFADDYDAIEDSLGSQADLEKNPFVALNTAHLTDGAFVEIGRSATVEKPIHLLFISVPEDEPAATHPRVLIQIAENAECTVVESYVGPKSGVYLTNAVTEIDAAADCRVEHYKLNQESPDAYHVATMQVALGRAGRFVSQSATVGGKLTRNDLNVDINGEGASPVLNGLVLLNGTQHCDNHTLLNHLVPNCPSYELYKHVLEGKATGVFKGQIYVHREAQKTDAVQNSRTLLLSDEAQMNSQPALEIYADDVKCTHGSTIGPVDEGAIFYLQSRGVSREMAVRLMTYAFAADLTRRIKVDPVRERLEDLMAARHGLPQDMRIQEHGGGDEEMVY